MDTQWVVLLTKTLELIAKLSSNAIEAKERRDITSDEWNKLFKELDDLNKRIQSS